MWEVHSRNGALRVTKRKRKKVAATGPPCVCPQCGLNPDEEQEGSPVPRLIAPNRIKCPKCPGIILERLPGDRPKPERHPKGLDTHTALVLFEQQRRIVKPNGSHSDPVGKSKPKPRRRIRSEQAPLGFKDPHRSTTVRLEDYPITIGLRLSREQDVWLAKCCSRYRADQTLVVKNAFLWFIKIQPKLDKCTVNSNWAARRNTTVKFEPSLWRTLRSVADAHHVAKCGTALGLILDYCQRKRVDVMVGN